MLGVQEYYYSRAHVFWDSSFNKVTRLHHYSVHTILENSRPGVIWYLTWVGKFMYVLTIHSTSTCEHLYWDIKTFSATNYRYVRGSLLGGRLIYQWTFDYPPFVCTVSTLMMGYWRNYCTDSSNLPRSIPCILIIWFHISYMNTRRLLRLLHGAPWVAMLLQNIKKIKLLILFTNWNDVNAAEPNNQHS